MATSVNLPSPSFYNAANARDWSYRADLGGLYTRAHDWRGQHGIKPGASDPMRILLLLIDLQKDFCFPEGTLPVLGRSGTGAMDDNARIAEFIYRSLAVLTDIECTLDTHVLFQIFFALFWLNANGELLDSGTIVDVSPNHKDKLANFDVMGNLLHDDVRPNPAMCEWLNDGQPLPYAWVCNQVAHYVKELAKANKYKLMLWPHHCVLDTEGHALAGVISEARAFHSMTRTRQNWCEIKGGNPFTENYSVFSPEVLTRWDRGSIASRNADFFDKTLNYDKIIIAGQAGSHCVKSSIDDFLDEIMGRDANLVKKIYVMRDCMSAVTIPDGQGGFAADFTSDMENAIQRFEDAGMHVVESTTPMDEWPDMYLAA